MSLLLLLSAQGEFPAPIVQTVFPYVDLVPSFDIDLVINKAVGTREGGTPQVVEDLTSQEQYFIRERQFTSQVTTDAEVYSQMSWKLGQFAQPLDRVESITGMPLVDPDDGDMVDAWLPREVGNRITVLETPPGFATAQSDEYTIQHLEGAFLSGPLQQLKIKFLLWPASTSSFWIAGDPVLSLAGETTRPGY